MMHRQTCCVPACASSVALMRLHNPQAASFLHSPSQWLTLLQSARYTVDADRKKRALPNFYSKSTSEETCHWPKKVANAVVSCDDVHNTLLQLSARVKGANDGFVVVAANNWSATIYLICKADVCPEHARLKKMLTNMQSLPSERFPSKLQDPPSWFKQCLSVSARKKWETYTKKCNYEANTCEHEGQTKQ